MNINFNNLEYKILLDMLAAARQVIITPLEANAPARSAYINLEQKILRMAPHFKAEKLVKTDVDSGTLQNSATFDEHSMVGEFLAEFANFTFWTELVERLALRDLIQQVGEKAVDAMDQEELSQQEQPLIEKYSQEFVENNLLNLRIRA